MIGVAFSGSGRLQSVGETLQGGHRVRRYRVVRRRQVMVVMVVMTVSREVGRPGAAGDAGVVPGHGVAMIGSDGFRRVQAVHFRVGGFLVAPLRLVVRLKRPKKYSVTVSFVASNYF